MMLAGIGDAPDTVEDRSVIIRMRRRAPDEKVLQFRVRSAEAEAQPLRDRFAGHRGTLRLARSASHHLDAGRQESVGQPEGCPQRAVLGRRITRTPPTQPRR